MSNWKKIREEKPKENEYVIIMFPRLKEYTIAVYDYWIKKFIDPSSNRHYDGEDVLWCKIPENDSED